MDDLAARGTSARRESKHVEFKSSFDPASMQDWCELVKDIVAMANSGGGVIVFGADNAGHPTGWDPSGVLNLDPATITDKISRYTGVQFSEFQVIARDKERSTLALLVVGAVEVPLVFTSPGTYQVSPGKQQTAFSRGTLYFRHGAKSEPANRDDLRDVIERNLKCIRRNWLQGVRKVVQAPRGSKIHVLPPDVLFSTSPTATPIRLVDDPKAAAYYKLTPDDTHPFRQKEVIAAVNKILHPEYQINQFDMRAVRAIQGIDENVIYSHHPKYSSPQYSQAFIDWLLKQFRANREFFRKARRAYMAARDRR